MTTTTITPSTPSTPAATYKMRRPDTDAPGEWIGYVGTSHGLLKVEAAARREVLRVACDDCGVVHQTNEPLWRERRRGEAVELVEAPPPKPKPNALRGRRVSDAQILETITTTDALTTEVAETLGYADGSALLERLKRMNSTAEKAGREAPFILTKGSGLKPGLVRRAGGTI